MADVHIFVLTGQHIDLDSWAGYKGAYSLVCVVCVCGCVCVGVCVCVCVCGVCVMEPWNTV